MHNSDISQFPITPYLSEICEELKKSSSHVLILTAETAAGKSTVLPLELMEQFSGKILMTEPRRLAVLGVSSRIAQLRGESTGQRVGYKIHLESNVSKETQLEVVTEAILVHQLQKDPALENYNLVVIDEFHERSVNTDLCLAFLKEALLLREDLFVIIMSATINTEQLRNYFENLPPVMEIPGRQFPVDVTYFPEASVETAVFKGLNSQKEGNILVFLPGISDIKKAQQNLESELENDDVEVCILHSSISLEDQKKVIGESGTKRKVILSSAIAETSLTVPGVNLVIDSGLARVNRMNISTGMENLVTEVESEFSAEQRKGRAGRLGPGKCFRLWSEFDPRTKDFEPEILRADLTELVLECAERGVYTFDGIDWLDKPKEAQWTECSRLLITLGMLKPDGRITEKGKLALRLGVHPRLASLVIEDFENSKPLLLKYSSYSKSAPYIQKRFIDDLERRLNGEGKSLTSSIPLILSGYPDRLAKRQSQSGDSELEYQFPNGRKAVLAGKNGEKFVNGPMWLVAPEVLSGKQKAVIYDFEVIDEKNLEEFLSNHKTTKEVCRFVNGKVQKTLDECYGQIVLSSKKVDCGPEDLAAAWVTEVQTKGIEALPLDSRTESFLLRVQFFEQQNKPLQDQSLNERICLGAGEWLPPFLSGGQKLTAQTVYDALYWFLDGSKIDSTVPEILELPNGRKVKVKYEKQAEIIPVVEIIIQRIFGCFTTPEVCGKKVLLRLLSPASRPLQVTQDLEHFWTGAWVEICKEMKGRYPKHNWDYRISE